MSDEQTLDRAAVDCDEVYRWIMDAKDLPAERTFAGVLVVVRSENGFEEVGLARGGQALLIMPVLEQWESASQLSRDPLARRASAAVGRVLAGGDLVRSPFGAPAALLA